MKILIGLLVAASAITAAYAQEGDKWFQGGTLHKSSLAAWKTATYENRLATTGDYVAMIIGSPKSYEEMDHVKVVAIQLEACITQTASSVSDAIANRQSASDSAIACATMMGFRR